MREEELFNLLLLFVGTREDCNKLDTCKFRLKMRGEFLAFQMGSFSQKWERCGQFQAAAQSICDGDYETCLTMRKRDQTYTVRSCPLFLHARKGKERQYSNMIPSSYVFSFFLSNSFLFLKMALGSAYSFGWYQAEPWMLSTPPYRRNGMGKKSVLQHNFVSLALSQDSCLEINFKIAYFYDTGRSSKEKLQSSLINLAFPAIQSASDLIYFLLGKLPITQKKKINSSPEMDF